MTVLALAIALVLAAPADEPAAPAPAVRARSAPAIPPVRPAVPIILRQQLGAGQLLLPGLGEAPPQSQRAIEMLPPQLLPRFLDAQRLRSSGEVAAARDTMRRLLEQAPHHALLLTELARCEGALGDWPAVEKLARAERAAAHDTLLLGRELTQALEQQKRPRDAAAVVLECWRVQPAEGDWAVETLKRLTPQDSRGVRELVHRTAAALPARLDLQTAAASLDWKMGDGAQALKSLAATDKPGLTPPLRWRFADALLANQAARDSAGAVDALVSMAADARFDASYRMMAARRAMDVNRARGTLKQGAPPLYAALKDVPPERWNPELLVDVARGLREAGDNAAARELLETPTARAPAQAATVTLERALNELNEGPPARAVPRLAQIATSSDEARWWFAEALFFAGLADSAAAEYKRVSADPGASFAGAAFDRLYLIEDASPKSALPAVGRMMWLDWRGDPKTALSVADSLSHTLPRGPLWARIAIYRAQQLEAASRYAEALAPLLAVADSLPNDRLAPLARQRAGDLYLTRLKKPDEALAQYEACLTRYPRAWNSPEVRRRVEALRKGRF